MIFSTKNKQLAIFGKTIDDIRTKLIKFSEIHDQYDYFGKNGVFASLFGSNKSQLIPEANLTKILSFDEANKQLEDFNRRVIQGGMSLDTYFKQYQNGNTVLRNYVTTTEQQNQSTQGLIKASQDARNAQIAHNEAIQAGTISAKAASVALKALSVAGNIIVFTLITKGIQLAVSAIDDFVHRTEKCKERVEELISTFNSAIDTASSHKQTLDEIKSRYEELSKGVNNLGENVSLTTDEYSEYNDIANQIADMFPTMVQGYTAEGNAILKLKENVEALTEAYETETQAAYNSLIASGKNSNGNDIIADWKNSLSEDKGKGTNIVQAIEELQAFMTSDMDAEMYTSLREKAAMGIYDGMTDAEKLIAGSEFIPFKLELDLDKDGTITDEELAKAKQSAKTLLQTYNAEIENDFSSVKTLANAYLMTNEDYKTLDEQSQAAASLLLNSIPATSDIAQVLMTGTQEELGEYVAFIVQALSSDNQEVSNALINLLTLDTENMSPDKIQSFVNSYISTIAEYLHEDENELKVRLGFETVDETAERYEEAVSKFGEDSKDTIVDFFKDNSINHSEEITYWNEVTEGAKTAAEAVEMYNKAQKESLADLPTFTEIFNSSDFADIKQKLLDLAKSGELTPSTLSSTEDYAKLLSETGLSAEKAANEIFDMLSVQEKLAAASSGMDKLKSAYEEFKDLGFVTASALESLPDSFKELDGFDLFSQIAGDPTQGTEKIQEAFNEIVKQYIITQDTLSSLTTASNSEIQSYIANLKEMGITNAEEVVNQVVNVLSQENQMLNEAEAEYMEYLLNKDTLDTDYLESVTSKNSQLVSALGAPYQSDYENWCDLLTKKSETYNEFVTRIGGSYDAALGAAGNLLANGKEVNSRTLQEYYTYKADYDQAAIEAQKKKDELNLDLSTIDTSFNTNFSPKSSGSGSSGSGSSSSASETKETFDFIEIAIKRIESAIDKLKSKAEDAFRTFSSRGKSYAETIKKMTDEIGLQEQAKQKYIERRDSIGLDESWAAQVRDGSLNIADITDDALKEQINEYGEWNDKVIECTESVADLKKEQEELVRDSIELLITKYDKLASKVSNAVEKIQNKIDLKETWGGSAKASDYVGMNKSMAKQVGYLEKQNSELKKLQKSVPRTSEAWHEYQEQMDGNSSSIQELTKNMAENAQAAASLAKAKADSKVEKYDSQDELYEAKIGNATTAKSKNGSIDKIISNIGNRQQEYKTAVKTSTKKLNSSASAINGLKSKKTNTKNKTTNAENKTYNAVLKKVKAQVKKGERIGTSLLNKATGLNDNLALYRACVQYNSYLDAKEENETIAELYAETAKSEKNALALQKFNNVAAEYGNKIQMSDYQMTALDNKISEIETAGKKVERSYYDTQKKVNAQKLADYQAEKTALEESIKNIKEGTDEWYEAYDQIQQVSSSISDCVKETYELNNAINQLHFDLFDDVSESIGRIITEQEFLRGLSAHEKNTDAKTGNFTDAGLANLGSLSASYYASKENAENDRIELQKLKAILAKGPNADGTYGDADLTFNSLEDLQAKIDETYTTWQNDIKETYSVESEIADLMKEKYQSELDLLQELIDAKKEALQSEKDLHDYQKSLNEKTKGITTMQKQIAAYSGDSSEEAMAKLQKLQKELADKEEDLRETEYDRYISDQEEMLDKLYKEYEELVTKKLDDFMTLVTEGLATANANMAAIAGYLSKVAKDNGYDVETDGLFNGSTGGIGENVGNAVSDIEKDKTATGGTASNTPTATNTPSSPTEAKSFAVATPPEAKSSITITDMVKDYVKKHANNAKKGKAKSEYTDVNQRIYENKSKSYSGTGKVLSIAEMKELSSNLGVKYDNPSKSGKLYKKLKEIKFPGFKKGGVVSIDDIEKQVHDNGDDGIVSVKNGEGILTSKQTEALQQFTEKLPETDNVIRTPDGIELIPLNPEDLIRELQSRSNNAVPDSSNMAMPNLQDLSDMIKPNIPDFSNMMKLNLPDVKSFGDMNNVVNIDTVSLPNVTNYQEFKSQMLHDIQTEKKTGMLLRDVVGVSQLAGGGKLDKYRHKF